MIYILTLTLVLNVPGNIGFVTTLPFPTLEACEESRKSVGLKHNLPEGLLQAAVATCVPQRVA